MIMKKIILILFFLIVFIPKTFASESIISSLIIDDEEREIEIVMDKDKMYLPCKYILSYFEIPYKENHADKSLSFKNATIKTGSFIIDGIKQNYSVYFVKQGMAGSQNEFFVPADALAKITGKNITTDEKQLLAIIKTRDHTEIKTDQNPFLVKSGATVIKAYEEITLPVPKGIISLDSVSCRNNMVSDSYSQIYKDSQSKSASMNSNIQTTLVGKLYSGDYKVDLGTNSYTNNFLSFSGLSVQYKNQFKNYDYLIGKTDDWDFTDTSVSSDLMGLQIKDHVENNDNYRNIEGNVHETSTVKVHINDDYKKDLNTYGGYYSLKDVYYNKAIKKIQIDEISADGSSKEILRKEFKGEEGKKNIPKRDFIMGINGLQNRLWANNGYIYQSTTKKFVMGFKHKKDISDKLTFENFLIADKITAGDASNSWNQSILGNNKKYLNFATMRNPNALEGETYMGALTYHNNEKMDSKLLFGGSNSTSIDTITPAGLGYFLRYDNNYHINNETNLKGSLFAASPSFYLAGTSSGGGGFISDRIGASLSGDTHFKNISLSGTYSKYKSNFGNYYEGGLIDFDEYNLVSRATFKKLPSISLKINKKMGTNEIAQISSGSYELSASKRLKCFNFNGGIRNNSYSNQYSAKGYSSYSSDYSNTFTEVSFPIGRKLGNATLGHEDVKTISDAMINDYKAVNVAYSTPTIKGFNFNASTGIHYAGTNKGNDMGLGITKRLKSGSTVSLNYRYSQTPFYVVDNMYLPSSMRHSITVDFSELYGIGDRGLQAIGTSNLNKGYLQVSAFLDVNQNGVRDKGEPLVENIPIKVENDSEVLLTSKNGKTKLKAEDAGVHNVKVFEDELPTFLSCHNKTKPSRYIKIENNSKTKVDFGLISSVGNINGSVTITDEFNNSLRIDDIVVSVLDANGKEVNYTNLNEDGTFSFSGLNPGKYFVLIDKELQSLHKLIPEKDSESLVIEIPPEYKDYVIIDNVNLNYKYQI